jgi:agmatinase
MTAYDPNTAAAKDSGIYGLNDSLSDAQLVFLPVPWEATTSYGSGTSSGPMAILNASRQVDLYDLAICDPYKAGFHLLAESKQVRSWNKTAKQAARKVIDAQGSSIQPKTLSKSIDIVNELSSKLNNFVYASTRDLVRKGKSVALLGGDHSTPFGAFKAISEKHSSFGILQIDAHSDTRKAFEGFTFSHASIMYNVMTRIPQVSKLVQVGIRDFCEEEVDFTKKQGKRMQVFYDEELAQARYNGTPWHVTTKKIVSVLPKKVWISFDIDGLDPRFCPHTGTPVPGGLEFSQATFLVEALVRSGREIIGLDLNEVAPAPNGSDEWDANVGARLAYKLAAWMLKSQGILRYQRERKA